MDEVAVIIPCLNEETTIGQVVADVAQALTSAAVYVYDNGSTDGTAEAALTAGAVVRPQPRPGKGATIRQALADVDASCYLIIDGDGTYPAKAAPELVDRCLAGTDLVLGDRLSGTYDEVNTRAGHALGNRLITGILNATFCGGEVTDALTGMRAISRRLARSCAITGDGFTVECEICAAALAARARIESVPITYRERPQGSRSKLKTIPDGCRILGFLIRLAILEHPLAFFGAVAAGLLISCATDPLECLIGLAGTSVAVGIILGAMRAREVRALMMRMLG